MILGDYNELTVVRESDIAYILVEDGSDEEIFLHKREALKEYEPGEKIRVFLYSDNKRRITASTKEALITINKPAFLQVVDDKETLGFFLNYGMSKDLLLAHVDLPFSREFYPQIGDKLYVCLKTTNNNMRAKLLPRQAIKENIIPTYDLNPGDEVDVDVFYVTEEGLITFTFDGHEVFIHKANTRDRYRVGQVLKATILFKKPDGTYNASLTKQKELMLEPDGKKIMNYLEKYKVVFLTDKSDSLEIYKVFQMSKNAYKRAIGHLYKQKLILIQDDCIILATVKLGES